MMFKEMCSDKIDQYHLFSVIYCKPVHASPDPARMRWYSIANINYFPSVLHEISSKTLF